MFFSFVLFKGIGCAAGQYSNSKKGISGELYKGSISCEICPSGFSSSASQYECTICETGQITNVNDKNEDATTLLHGASDCEKCQAGKYSAYGNKEMKTEMQCQACPSGFNAGTQGLDECSST